MSRATSLERIEKLRAQLEEAERKEAEKAERQQAAAKEKAFKKRETLVTRLKRLRAQQDKIAEQVEETLTNLQEIDDEFGEVFASVELEVVEDGTEASDVA